MDICNLDWQLIVKILPSLITGGVALFIFSKWKNQKSSEVIANEAKVLIIKIARLQSLQCEIFKEIQESQGAKFPEDELKDFKKIKEEVSDSMNFLGFALQHDRSLSQLPSIVLSQAVLFIRDIERYQKGEKAINSKYFSIIDSSDALTLTELLLNYAMYKKSIDKGWFNKYKKF